MLACMTETDSLMLVALLAVCAGLLLLLVMLLVVMMRAGQSLGRIERLLGRRGGAGVDAASVGAASVLATRKSRHESEFEAFLKEDSTRQQLTKGEQFSAYRRWRQEKGLNWSKS